MCVFLLSAELPLAGLYLQGSRIQGSFILIFPNIGISSRCRTLTDALFKPLWLFFFLLQIFCR